VATSLRDVKRAVRSASPWCSPLRQRYRMVMFARHQGWRDAVSVARVIGISSSHVRRIWRSAAEVDLAPAALCLGDERLMLDAEHACNG
jgi:hypothetical protein